MAGLRIFLAAAALLGFSAGVWACAVAANRPGGSRAAELVAAGGCALLAASALVELVLIGAGALTERARRRLR